MSRAVVVMGVSGSGKSTIGPLLAGALGVAFADADDFHPPANIAKMAAGTPLSDDDRWPWLDALGAHLAQAGGVIGCSALKRAYRDRLRTHRRDAAFLHLAGDPALIAARQAARPGHFMPPALLASQFATLEPPGADEAALALDIGAAPEAVVARALAWLSREGA
jgi:gluconokinase